MYESRHQEGDLHKATSPAETLTFVSPFPQGLQAPFKPVSLVCGRGASYQNFQPLASAGPHPGRLPLTYPSCRKQVQRWSPPSRLGQGLVTELGSRPTVSFLVAHELQIPP